MPPYSAYRSKDKVPYLSGQRKCSGELDDLHLGFGSCLDFLLDLINFSKCTMRRQVILLLIDWQSYTTLFFCSQMKMHQSVSLSNHFSSV